MRTVDALTRQAERLIQRLLDFFEERVGESRPLISKDISFYTFSRFEKLSKLLHDFRKNSPDPDHPVNCSVRLAEIRSSLFSTYLDPQLVEDLITSVDNAWPYLENTFCEDIDVADLKKEVIIKLKCQSSSEFSNDREDIAVISLILLEEFCRYVDQVAEALRVVHLNDKAMAELTHSLGLDPGRGFTRFFEVQKSHRLLTDFYQSLARYVSTLTDNLEANVRTLKMFRVKKDEDTVAGPLLLGTKQTVYKEFVQKKMAGLIGLIQKKAQIAKPPPADGLDEMTSEFLSKIVHEVSVSQFEDHLKELGTLGKPLKSS